MTVASRCDCDIPLSAVAHDLHVDLAAEEQHRVAERLTAPAVTLGYSKASTVEPGQSRLDIPASALLDVLADRVHTPILPKLGHRGDGSLSYEVVKPSPRHLPRPFWSRSPGSALSATPRCGGLVLLVPDGFVSTAVSMPGLPTAGVAVRETR